MKTIKQLKKIRKLLEREESKNRCDERIRTLEDVSKHIDKRINSIDRKNNSWLDERANELEFLKKDILGE